MKHITLCVVEHPRDHYPEVDPMTTAQDELWKKLGLRLNAVKIKVEIRPVYGGDPDKVATVVSAFYEL